MPDLKFHFDRLKSNIHYKQYFLYFSCLKSFPDEKPLFIICYSFCFIPDFL